MTIIWRSPTSLPIWVVWSAKVSQMMNCSHNWMTPPNDAAHNRAHHYRAVNWWTPVDCLEWMAGIWWSLWVTQLASYNLPVAAAGKFSTRALEVEVEAGQLSLLVIATNHLEMIRAEHNNEIIAQTSCSCYRTLVDEVRKLELVSVSRINWWQMRVDLRIPLEWHVLIWEDANCVSCKTFGFNEFDAFNEMIWMCLNRFADYASLNVICFGPKGTSETNN